ncbi:hypothetical protein HRG_013853 [Hirsutella rhossiliensis]
MAASQARADRHSEGGDRRILQLCEWHAAENFKKRLLDSGKYTKERREELLRLVWDYIQAPDEEQLEKRRGKLLAEIREPERLYLENNWKPKERQFARAHTRKYPNLGCNNTQRNESYHVVVKQSLSRQLPLQASCQKLAESLKKLTQKITEDENRSRADVPRLLDRAAFRLLIGKVPHYVLSKLAPEWEAAKALRWRQNTELEKERKVLGLLNEPGCPFASDLRAQLQSRALLPPELPEALHSPGLKRFKSHGSTKMRSMTGREAAEHTAAQADRATSDLLKGVDQPPDPSSTPSSPLATSPQLPRETRRSRERSTKDIEKSTIATGKSPDRAGKARKGEEPDMPKPRCKKRKASKEDETQLELQQRPTQDCILVDFPSD